MSLRNNDLHGRWRSKSVTFNVSPEEAETIDRLVSISGLTKRGYICTKLLNRDVVVVPNTRVQKALRDNMLLVYGELKRIRKTSEMKPELEDAIQILTKVFSKLGGEDFISEVELAEQAINKMDRI